MRPKRFDWRARGLVLASGPLLLLGGSCAMAAGIDAATGEVLIPMDADLQNDPVDIIRLLKKLDEGYGLAEFYDDGSFDYAYTPFGWKAEA